MPDWPCSHQALYLIKDCGIGGESREQGVVQDWGSVIGQGVVGIWDIVILLVKGLQVIARLSN